MPTDTDATTDRPDTIHEAAAATRRGGAAARHPARRGLGAVLAALLVLGVAVVTEDSVAAGVPAGHTERIVVSGLERPTAFAFLPDGRVLVTEQGGDLEIVSGGVQGSQPALRLSVDSRSERGLLGVAVSPDFVSTGHIFLYYTVPGSPPHNRLARFTLSGSKVVAGPLPLLDLPGLGAGNHNGGGVEVATDGTLFVGVGDNAVGDRAQNLDSPFGKVLRVTRTGAAPASNPFAGRPGRWGRYVWQYGLRNPFTMAVDPVSSRLYVNDVGESSWEEIDSAGAGANFGWPLVEGPGGPFTRPLHAYPHGSGPGRGCSIAGGAAYRPSQLTLGGAGDYFFGDFCGGWVDRRNRTTGAITHLVTGRPGIVGVRTRRDGSLWYLARSGGILGRVQKVANSATFLLRDGAGGGPATRTDTRTASSVDDVALACDLDADGDDDPVLFSGRTWQPGGYTFGRPGDQPVCGDWNGDGTVTDGVVRGATWYLRDDLSSDAVRVRRYGTDGDVPVTGDWDSDGDTDIGVVRGALWLLRPQRTDGPASVAFVFGRTGDRAVPAQWVGGPGVDASVFRPHTGEWFAVDGLRGGVASSSFRYGQGGDVPVAGDWDGDGDAGPGVVRFA